MSRRTSALAQRHGLQERRGFTELQREAYSHGNHTRVMRKNGRTCAPQMDAVLSSIRTTPHRHRNVTARAAV